MAFLVIVFWSSDLGSSWRGTVYQSLTFGIAGQIARLVVAGYDRLL
jgi:hypothetical protein